MPAALSTDLRLTVRHLRAHPGYAVAAIVTLALAVGATTAMFSAVYAVLLAPQPIRAADRLVVGWGLAPEISHGLVELTYRDIEALAAASRTVAPMAAVGASTWTAVLEGHDEPARVAYAGVSGAFFETLGVRPVLGRALQPQDDVPGGANVLVLSHHSWLARFGGDPAIVGRTLRLDGETQTVVGVMPPGFDYPRGAEFWTPLAPGLAAASAVWKTDALANVGVLMFIGRLRDGATAEGAAADLSAAGRRIDQGRPVPQIGATVAVTPFTEHVVGPAQPALWALLGAVVVLLLIACVNVSGLMLTRASHARREHAIQLAMGASDRTLARQWLVESVVLAGLGGAAGIAVASALTSAMLALAPDGIPRLTDAAINVPVALAAIAATAAAAVVCGAGPMRLARGPQLLEALHESARTTAAARPRRLRATLVGLQVAMAVVLLVAAGLVTRSFQALRGLDLGFQASQVLVAADRSAARAGAGERLDAHAASTPSPPAMALRPWVPCTCVRYGSDRLARARRSCSRASPTQRRRRRRTPCSTTRWRRPGTSARCAFRCAPAGSSARTTATVTSESPWSANRRRGACGRTARRSGGGC